MNSIDYTTYGLQKGSKGHYTINSQLAGRELLTSDEVRMLDNRYALLFLRGENPVIDQKYDLLKHPNISKSADGGAESYTYGEDALSFASVVFDVPEDKMPKADDIKGGDFIILTDDELKSLISKKMEVKNEKQKKH